MTDAKFVDSKIEALLRKQSALKAALAERKVQVQKKNENEKARLFSIIGSVVIENAARHVDYELMLKSVLQTTPTSLNDSDKKLLRSKGWL